jgi:pup-ligase protein
VSNCLFGLETEYAIDGIAGGQPVAARTLAGWLASTARDTLTHVPDGNGGLFLANGARLYGDCGWHPEFCTPECTDPWDAVRYVRAGDRILQSLVERMKARHPEFDVSIRRGNVDYCSPTTWGCHESYLMRVRHADLPRQLIPHLVSRIVFTGAGGFDPFATAIDFTLSPRAGYFCRAISGESTSDRGIFHTRDKPLAGHGYHRVHIICGESLCSDVATWLKVGTTALVIALIDAGVRPGEPLELADAVAALRTVVADPACRAEVRLAQGGRATAIAIQRRYLAAALQHRRGSFMPPWTADVCAVWGDMLDRIERQDASIHTTLDWAIKRVLYARYAERQKISWSTLKDHSREALADLDRPEAAAMQRLRRALHELDTKFGRLGDDGIFSRLDRQPGVLAHRLPAARSVDDAVRHPPATGRANIRGRAIARLSGNPDCRADWDTLIDGGQSSLDLSDPFVSTEQWKAWRGSMPPDCGQRSCDGDQPSGWPGRAGE